MSCLASSSLAMLFTFASALWQHTSSATAATVLEATAGSVIRGNVGSVATVLAWLTFGLWFIVFMMVVVMLLSIAILDRLTY